jgi:hypothetical protein
VKNLLDTTAYQYTVTLIAQRKVDQNGKQKYGRGERRCGKPPCRPSTRTDDMALRKVLVRAERPVGVLQRHFRQAGVSADPLSRITHGRRRGSQGLTPFSQRPSSINSVRDTVF